MVNRLVEWTNSSSYERRSLIMRAKYALHSTGATKKQLPYDRRAVTS